MYLGSWEYVLYMEYIGYWMLKLKKKEKKQDISRWFTMWYMIMF